MNKETSRAVKSDYADGSEENVPVKYFSPRDLRTIFFLMKKGKPLPVKLRRVLVSAGVDVFSMDMDVLEKAFMGSLRFKKKCNRGKHQGMVLDGSEGGAHNLAYINTVNRDDIESLWNYESSSVECNIKSKKNICNNSHHCCNRVFEDVEFVLEHKTITTKVNASHFEEFKSLIWVDEYSFTSEKRELGFEFKIKPKDHLFSLVIYQIACEIMCAIDMDNISVKDVIGVVRNVFTRLVAKEVLDKHQLKDITLSDAQIIVEHSITNWMHDHIIIIIKMLVETPKILLSVPGVEELMIEGHRFGGCIDSVSYEWMEAIIEDHVIGKFDVENDIVMKHGLLSLSDINVPLNRHAKYEHDSVDAMSSLVDGVVENRFAGLFRDLLFSYDGSTIDHNFNIICMHIIRCCVVCGINVGRNCMMSVVGYSVKDFLKSVRDVNIPGKCKQKVILLEHIKKTVMDFVGLLSCSVLNNISDGICVKYVKKPTGIEVLWNIKKLENFFNCQKNVDLCSLVFLSIIKHRLMLIFALEHDCSLLGIVQYLDSILQSVESNLSCPTCLEFSGSLLVAR